MKTTYFDCLMDYTLIYIYLLLAFLDFNIPLKLLFVINVECIMVIVCDALRKINKDVIIHIIDYDKEPLSVFGSVCIDMAHRPRLLLNWMLDSTLVHVRCFSVLSVHMRNVYVTYIHPN